MARLIRKGQVLTGTSLKVLSMTWAEYQADKEALDRYDGIIEITDKDCEDIDADDIAYSDTTTVKDAIDEINSNLSEQLKCAYFRSSSLTVSTSFAYLWNFESSINSLNATEILAIIPRLESANLGYQTAQITFGIAKIWNMPYSVWAYANENVSSVYFGVTVIYK